MSTLTKNVAIVGGGITGCMAASVLSKHCKVHLYDQGRNGVGGRASTRNGEFDHGCQFFRADTPVFRKVVDQWCAHEVCQEWTGRFSGEETADFFGLPSANGSVFIGKDGIQSVLRKLINEECQSSHLGVYNGTRVDGLQRNGETKRWKLSCNRDDAPKQEYDAVLLTDIRTPIGAPKEFADQVQSRVGAKVPLFSAMITFEKPLEVDFDAKSFASSDILWFASRMKSKNLGNGEECWTLISTPEYAVKLIEENPIYDPNTGEFIPQSRTFLSTVPAPGLLNAFQNTLNVAEFPATIHVSAQRWGGAMFVNRKLDSSLQRTVGGAIYDVDRTRKLAPTTLEDGKELGFVADDSQMIFQAGDALSRYTPGFEGAALSGMEAANHILSKLSQAGHL